MVLNTSASANGLIRSSGRVEQKRELLALMDSLALSYGDDWWFIGHHAFALAENGQHETARTKIDQSIARNPTNAYGAHTRAHLYYEAGDLASGQAFLRSWLATYPCDGGFYGHLSWHLALFELQADDAAPVFRLYSQAVAPEINQDPAISILANAASFLWRWELAGQPHDLSPPRSSRYGDQRDRLVGSLAQTDLVEGMLLRAYMEAGRLNDVHRLLGERRGGAVGLPIAGVAAVH